MPFMMSKVNIPINEDQEIQLKSRLGKAIELLPGLSEEYLMAGFEDNQHIYLRGDKNQAVAYIEVSIFGNEIHYGYDKLTAEITKIFNEVLKINPKNIYIKYDDINDWSVNGINFDRNDYK